MKSKIFIYAVVFLGITGIIGTTNVQYESAAFKAAERMET
ncbi:hypothetical protein CHCC20335_4295 [Bacillus paralicheniformis]|nr:hypothetical protein CHCC20335_4295 [Bacillus paralicheniformis]